MDKKQVEDFLRKRTAELAVLGVLSCGVCAFAVRNLAHFSAERTVLGGNEQAVQIEQTEQTTQGEANPFTQEVLLEEADESEVVAAKGTTSTALQEFLAGLQSGAAATTEKVSSTASEDTTDALDISFYAIDQTVRENNLNVRSNSFTLKGLNEMSIDDVIDAYKGQKFALGMQYTTLQNMANDVSGITVANSWEYVDADGTTKTISDGNGPALSSLKGSLLNYINYSLGTVSASISGIDATIDELRDEGAEEYFNKEATRRQLTYAEDSIVNGAETLYIAVATQKLNLADGERGLAALDRTLTEMQARYRLGQVSELTVAQLQSQRDSTAAQLETLDFTIKQLETDLSNLLGWDLDTRANVIGLGEVTAEQVRAMNYNNDLATALEESFNVFTAEEKVDTAKDDYGDSDADGTEHYITSAQVALQQTKRSETQAFRKIFNAVAEKQRLVESAKSSYETAVRVYDAAEKQYQLGKISNHALQSELDTLDAAKSAITAAQYELFSAYNQYQWALRGVIAS